jgi:hypothetical protein
MTRSRLVGAFVPMGVGLTLMCGPTTSFANDNCRRLEALSRQYANVELTSGQKQMKRQMTAWYNRNCQLHQSAEAN